MKRLRVVLPMAVVVSLLASHPAASEEVAEDEWSPDLIESTATVDLGGGETLTLSESPDARQDWCKKLLTVQSRPWDYSYNYRRMTMGNCAHQQFEKDNLGSRVKYGRTGAAAVPDGTKYVLKELKPSTSKAQKAANRTARITGIRTYGYRWVHLGGTRFEFRHVATSRTGTTKYKISTSWRFRMGPLPPIGVGGGTPWYLLHLSPTATLDHSPDGYTVPVHEALSSDWALTMEAWWEPTEPVNADGLTAAEEALLADFPAIENEFPIPAPKDLYITKSREDMQSNDPVDPT